MGRYWAKIAQISDFSGKLKLGFIMRVWRERGSRWMGMRSRAPPVADAARRSIRSGRENRASEQREDFFGHRKAVGADTPWLPLERICAQYGFGFFAPEKSKFVSSTASDRKGFVKGESVPLDHVLPTFARTKVGPRRAGVLTIPLQKTPRRDRRLQI